MRRLLWIGLVLLLIAGSALPALAATAEFQGNCNNTPGTPLRTDCVFNATRVPSWGGSATSCSPSSITQYFWDYGDGASEFTTSYLRSHTYFGASCWDIDLAVFCTNGSSASASHCLCNNIGFGGCIIPGAGWTP
jgi:hypothetical protein